MSVAVSHCCLCCFELKPSHHSQESGVEVISDTITLFHPIRKHKTGGLPHSMLRFFIFPHAFVLPQHAYQNLGMYLISNDKTEWIMLMLGDEPCRRLACCTVPTCCHSGSKLSSSESRLLLVLPLAET